MSTAEFTKLFKEVFFMIGFDGVDIGVRYGGADWRESILNFDTFDDACDVGEHWLQWMCGMETTR